MPVWRKGRVPGQRKIRNGSIKDPIDRHEREPGKVERICDPPQSRDQLRRARMAATFGKQRSVMEVKAVRRIRQFAEKGIQGRNRLARPRMGDRIANDFAVALENETALRKRRNFSASTSARSGREAWIWPAIWLTLSRSAAAMGARWVCRRSCPAVHFRGALSRRRRRTVLRLASSPANEGRDGFGNCVIDLRLIEAARLELRLRDQQRVVAAVDNVQGI